MHIPTKGLWDGVHCNTATFRSLAVLSLRSCPCVVRRRWHAIDWLTADRRYSCRDHVLLMGAQLQIRYGLAGPISAWRTDARAASSYAEKQRLFLELCTQYLGRAAHPSFDSRKPRRAALAAVVARPRPAAFASQPPLRKADGCPRGFPFDGNIHNCRPGLRKRAAQPGEQQSFGEIELVLSVTAPGARQNLDFLTWACRLIQPFKARMDSTTMLHLVQTTSLARAKESRNSAGWYTAIQCFAARRTNELSLRRDARHAS